MPHAPAMQAAAALAAVAQRRAQAPQLSGSLAKLASQPSSTLALQLPKPASQVTAHALAAQLEAALARAGHALPHAPQFAAELRTSVSQPLAALPSQLPEPAVQVMVHAPAVHTGAPPGPGGHTVPQAPQLATLFNVRVSQPLAAMPSQSP